MKKLVLLCAVVCLTAGICVAQSDALHSSDTVLASVSRGSAPSDGLKIGPNMVCGKVIRAGVVIHEWCNHNLKTTVGLDAMVAQVGTTGSQPASFTYLALSSDSGAPVIGDTTLASEIATNGLSRHVATYAHTGGTNSWTETYTWTATGAVSNVQKAGLFNASSSGTMGFENSFSPVSLNTNDQLQLTWTITAS